MKDVLESLFKFGSEFTWRKFLTLLVVSFIACGVLLLFERYTSSFRFSRLQKASDLLVRLQEIEHRGTNNTPELERARKALVAEAVKAIEEKPFSLEFIPSKLAFSMESVWKFVAGGSLLWVLALFQLPKYRKAPAKNPMLGFLLLGGISGFVGIFITPIAWPWFHIFIFPWLLLIGIAVVTIPAALVFAMLPSVKAKSNARTCRHNLIQIDGAAQQWALENKKTKESIPGFEDLLPYFRNGTVPMCPSGGIYILKPVAEVPLCTESSHSL